MSEEKKPPKFIKLIDLEGNPLIVKTSEIEKVLPHTAGSIVVVNDCYHHVAQSSDEVWKMLNA